MAATDKPTDSAWAELARAVKAGRAKRRWNQEKLATEAEVSLSTVQAIEGGKPPSSGDRTKLAYVTAALEWPTDYAEHILSGHAVGPPVDGNAPNDPYRKDPHTTTMWNMVEQLQAERGNTSDTGQREADLLKVIQWATQELTELRGL